MSVVKIIKRTENRILKRDDEASISPVRSETQVRRQWVNTISSWVTERRKLERIARFQGLVLKARESELQSNKSTAGETVGTSLAVVQAKG